MVIIASESGGVMMVGLADNKLIRKVDHGAIVDAIAVTNDQTRLITGGRDGKTRLWNIADGKPILSMEGDPETRLLVASANRDALRQKGAVERLNQKTGELEKLLAKETEALTKVTEEHKKATETLAAEEQKHVDAVAVVTSHRNPARQGRSRCNQSNPDDRSVNQTTGSCEIDVREDRKGN